LLAGAALSALKRRNGRNSPFGVSPSPLFNAPDAPWADNAWAQHREIKKLTPFTGKSPPTSPSTA